MKLIAATVLVLVTSGCAFRLAKGEYLEGFSSVERDDGSFLVRYNGKAMESASSLERLLRVGVSNVCAGGTYALTDLAVETMEVMHRWKSPFRYVSAIASCKSKA
jgi:hypothetical protein